MKNFSGFAIALGAAVLSLVFFVVPGRAQVAVTYVGETSGGTLPGSATDFVFPDSDNFPGYPTTDYSVETDATYSQLSSFYLFGGVNGSNGNSSYSSIVTPAGGPAIQTGQIAATGDVSFGLVPGLTQEFLSGANGGFNANFNYNDFNVYLMYSNTGGAIPDTSITLAPDTYNGSAIGSLGSAVTVTLNGGSGPLDAPTDTNTDTSTAYYLEFNVQGLGSAVTAANASDLEAFLNVSATGSASATYIGAISFESVPEPSTWAMLLGGMGAFFVVQRLRRKLSA